MVVEMSTAAMVSILIFRGSLLTLTLSGIAHGLRWDVAELKLTFTTTTAADSDLEELNQVEVVDHASSETRNSAPSSMMAKREMKAYMVCNGSTPTAAIFTRTTTC